MENFSPDLKIFIPVLFWFYMAGKFFGCLKKKYFLLPHTAELCLYWNPYLRIPFWPSKFSTFCSLSHWNLVLAVTVLLLLVLLLAKSTITSLLVSEPMFTYEKVLMRTCKLFSTPGWSFSSAFENRAENSSPGVNSALGWKFYYVIRKLKTVDFCDIMEWNFSPDTLSKFQPRA